MKKIITVVTLALLCASMYAQAPVTFGWGSTDIHYSRNEKPSGLSKKSPFSYAAWKGETVNAEAVIWSEIDLSSAKLEVSDLKSGSSVIPSSSVSADFISYVWGDVLAEDYNQCGARNKSEWDSVYVADAIGIKPELYIEAHTAQPVWLGVKVPANAAKGIYKGTVTLRSESVKTPVVLPYSIEVSDRVLPSADKWPFHLDLWQNPYAVARYHNVPLWSEEHFKYLRPVMEKLASAGQKVITTTIMNRAWNGQTEDPFGPMVTKIRKADGTWLYDYTVFDMWVEFMMSCGIKDQINCYTLIPWKLTFDYFDQATNSPATVDAKPGTTEYDNYWGRFIIDFARHLREKGWFDITYIAMDERGEEPMRNALALINRVEPEFKVALAGSYHDSIADDIDDLCLGFRASYPEGAVAKRRNAGRISTYYTCCAEGYPNTFIASRPAESTWIPMYALASDVDGYLRWAFNSWTIDPVNDARFRTWAAGDCYMIYPDACSSVRLEKFIEGMQDYEKARILRDEWQAKGDVKNLTALQDALKCFTYEEITVSGPEPAIKKVRTVINKK